MSAPTIPIITSPLTGATIHFGGSQKKTITCTIEDAEQVIKVFIGGVFNAAAYSESGTTIIVPLVQLSAGSNVITAKALNFASELSTASDSVTVTGVDTSVSGETNLQSYIVKNLISYLQNNATIVAKVNKDSIFTEGDKELVAPAIVLSNLLDEVIDTTGGYDINEFTFRLNVIWKDLRSGYIGTYNDTGLGDSKDTAFAVLDILIKEVLENKCLYLSNVADLGRTGRAKDEGDAELRYVYADFKGIMFTPKLKSCSC